MELNPFNKSKARRSKFFFFLLTFAFFPFSVFSQPAPPVMEKLAGQLHALSLNSPSELVYIQTSKDIYETGEDLWFKVYLLDTHYFTTSVLSQTLYLQVVSEKTGKAVWQEKYEIQNGFANGHVFLQDSLTEGDYWLETFTQHSLFNDSTEIKAIRKIRVMKAMNPRPQVTSDSISIPGKKKSPIQFNTFPEGGNLIAGIQSKLAFKAVNTNGNPLAVAGTLFEDDNPLQEFKSIHAGMGSLNFTPLSGKKYHIHLTEPATDSAFLLPEVYPEGITMRLDGQDKEYLKFIVLQSAGQANRTICLRGQLRGVVCCMATGMLNQELKIKIPLKEFFGQGIAEFTLFDEKLVPVAERLVYLNPEKKLYIEAKLSKDKYETRQKATLKIKATDQNGQPVVANLGVSVFDRLYQNPQDPETILTHCFLSEQLKGRIYDPAYYFDEKNKDREQALDLLVLTQGWRRYVWGEENLKASGGTRMPVIFDGTEGEIHATKKLKQAPKGEQFVMAFNPGENKNSDLVATDSTGRFTVTPNHLKAWQGGYVYLKPLSPPEFEPRISLTDPFQTINGIMKTREIIYPLPNMVDTTKEMTARPYVLGPLNEIELGEVTITGKKINPFRDKYMGHLDSIAKVDLTSVWVCCHGYLENYKMGYSHECDNYDDSIRAKPIEGKTYRVIRYEDGGRKDGRKIVTDVYNTEWHYPKFTEEELLKMNNLSPVKAYYPHRKFYQPNYDKPTVDYFSPDSRNTLLWAPSVITNENGEATLDFFCSDINTTFVGKIEGVSGDGLLGTKDFEFAVRKLKPFKWEK